MAVKTFELSELLVDVLGVTEVGAYFPHRVTYHPTCHSLRMLRVGDKPLQLLRAVDGIDLVALPEADQCCGFGGTFAIKNADTSTAMLADKMQNVLATRAEICTAGDSSCLMHIGGGLSRIRAGSADPPSGADPGLDPGGAACWSALRQAQGTTAATRHERSDAPEPVEGAGVCGCVGARRAWEWCEEPRHDPGDVGHAAVAADVSARGGQSARGRDVPGGGPQEPHQCPVAAQSRQRDPHDPGQTGRGGRRGRRLGRAPGGRPAAQGAHHGAPAGVSGPARAGGHGSRRHRALGAGRGRGQPDRDRPDPGQGRRRGGQGQVHGHPGDRAERSARGRRHRRAGDRSGRTDRSAGTRQAVAHPGAGDPPQPGGDPGDLPARDAGRRSRSDRRSGRAGRRRPAPSAPQVLVGEGRDQRGQLRRRGDRNPGRGGIRGQRPDVPDPAGDLDHDHGDREAGARAGRISRSSCSCCRAPRPASG